MNNNNTKTLKDVFGIKKEEKKKVKKNSIFSNRLQVKKKDYENIKFWRREYTSRWFLTYES